MFNLFLLFIFLGQQVADGSTCEANGVHVALTGIQNQIRITWSSGGQHCSPAVSYRLDGSTQLRSVLGDIDHYQPDDMCQKPAIHAEFDKFYIYSVVIEQLQPLSKYYYTIPADEYFQERWFVTPPEVSPAIDTRFIMVGDTGEHIVHAKENPGSQITFESISKLDFGKYRMLAHVGDLSYADGAPQAWKTFLDLIEPIAQHVPYMIAIGNHEFDYKGDDTDKNDPSGVSHYVPSWGDFDSHDSGGECGIPTVKHFPMTQYQDGGNAPFWYSYDYGSVHFITLSSEHSLGHSHPQYAFLEEDLKHIDRCGKTPWVIVQIHRPLYALPASSKNYKIASHLRDHIEDLLLKYQVDLVVNGHQHIYYRSCPVAEEVCQKSEFGITNICIGNGGRKLDSSKKYLEDNPQWFVHGKEEYGFALFDIDAGSDKMKVTMQGSLEGEIIDQFFIKSKAAGICQFQVA
eukprot:TRINITY_DN7717_c0_g2_i5.p1 TRINITY_DN7717_c0_g2~~TRINITY_DN7717_c0_g2_i5.p1  ORF type:complete len:490 (-),score=22.01 TRINITY_DN7717_c0_g2_i5:501-1877(-)